MVGFLKPNDLKLWFLQTNGDSDLMQTFCGELVTIVVWFRIITGNQWNSDGLADFVGSEWLVTVNHGKSINSWHFSSCFLGICQGFCFRIQEMWNDWQLLMAECWGLQGCWKKQTCESPAQLVVMLQCQCLLLSRWFGLAVLMETHWDPADLIWILCVIDTSVNWVYLGMTWSGSSSKFSKRARFSQVLPHGHH